MTDTRKAARQARYDATPKGRARHARYDATPKGRERKLEYRRRQLGWYEPGGMATDEEMERLRAFRF